MDWVDIITNAGLFFWVALKFMVFSPIAALKFDFWTGVIFNISAGFSGVSFFFFLSDYFLERAYRKRVEREKKGAPPKKKFTRVNKFLVRGKRTLGLAGIALLTPMFISIPVGSLITAKFFTHTRWAYPALLMAVVFWAFVMGGLASLFPDLFDTLFPNANKA